MTIFHQNFSKTSCAIFLSLLITQYNFALAETTNISAYTDQQLLAAGWTAKQIADARASSQTKEQVKKDTVKDKVDYVSAFKDYRSFEDLPEIEWREANDNVGRIGGWLTYARQVQAEQKKESTEGDDK